MVQQFAVEIKVFFVEADEDNFLRHLAGLQKGGHGVDGDSSCFILRKVINARADIGKGDGLQPLFRGESKTIPIRRGQQLNFAVSPILPNRPHGMDDIFRRQPASRCDHRLPGGATALAVTDGPAFFQNGRPSGAMDSSIDAATPEKGAVRGIDDGVGRHFCNIALLDVDAGIHQKKVKLLITEVAVSSYFENCAGSAV